MNERRNRDWDIGASANALDAVISRSYDGGVEDEIIETITLHLRSIPPVRPGQEDNPHGINAYPKIALTVCPARASVDLTASRTVVLGIASVSRIRTLRDRIVVEADSGVCRCTLTITREGGFVLRATPYSIDPRALLDDLGEKGPNQPASL